MLKICEKECAIQYRNIKTWDIHVIYKPVNEYIRLRVKISIRNYIFVLKELSKNFATNSGFPCVSFTFENA